MSGFQSGIEPNNLNVFRDGFSGSEDATGKEGFSEGSSECGWFAVDWLFKLVLEMNGCSEGGRGVREGLKL